MHPIIARTFGGLSAAYYFRQFLFGLAFSIFAYSMASRGAQAVQLPALFFIALNTLLYPYSRFVYESVVGFVVGDNIFIVNAVLMIALKFITITACWAFAIFIAPIGLAYLYFHHSRALRSGQE